MKPTEIKAMQIEGLKAKDESLREELFNLRMQNSTGQVENPLKIRDIRRDIARVGTELKQRDLAGKAGAKA